MRQRKLKFPFHSGGGGRRSREAARTQPKRGSDPGLRDGKKALGSYRSPALPRRARRALANSLTCCRPHSLGEMGSWTRQLVFGFCQQARKHGGNFGFGCHPKLEVLALGLAGELQKKHLILAHIEAQVPSASVL